jgi:hypothetical protein
MLTKAIADTAVAIISALLPDIIAAVKQGGDEKAIRRRVLIKVRRKAIEAAYDRVAKELK